MRKEKKAVKNQNIFLNEISHALRTILVMNNIGLNFGDQTTPHSDLYCKESLYYFAILQPR